jgi:hypothetical protein
MMTRLPDQELRDYLGRVQSAIDAGTQGDVPQGRQILGAGLEYAAEQAREGRYWAGELVRRYRFALESYGQQFRAPGHAN